MQQSTKLRQGESLTTDFDEREDLLRTRHSPIAVAVYRHLRYRCKIQPDLKIPRYLIHNISEQIGLSEENGHSIVNACVDLALLGTDEQWIWSSDLMEQRKAAEEQTAFFRACGSRGKKGRVARRTCDGPPLGIEAAPSFERNGGALTKTSSIPESNIPPCTVEHSPTIQLKTTRTSRA